MNKKQGFTLIELLAVIIILAILALIISPIASNIVKESKKHSAERSMEGYIEAVNTASLAYQSQTGKRPTSVNILDIAYKNNEQITNQDVLFSKSGIVASAQAKINGFLCKYTELEGTTCRKELTIGQVVYFNPVTGNTCKDYKVEYSENETTDYNKCFKWYVISDGEETIDLILDHNTTKRVAWVSKEGYGDLGGDKEDYEAASSTDGSGKIYIQGLNNLGPKDVLDSLYNDTQTWSNSLARTDKYVIDQALKISTASYTIDYTNYNGSGTAYKARLITTQEIADIVGYTTLVGFNEQIGGNWFYLDGTGSTASQWQTPIANRDNRSKYAWLYDYTYECVGYGCNMADIATKGYTYGYWTSSSNANSAHSAWRLSYTGQLSFNEVSTTSFGVRPVITIKTSLISN